MRLLLSINQSLAAVRSNLLRASVTIFIIALGITALILVMTSIEGIRYGMTSSFSSLGANNFRIINKASAVNFQRRGRGRTSYPSITFIQASEFQRGFEGLAAVSVTGSGGTVKVKYRNEETNQNIQLIGGDRYYPETSRMELEAGRSLTEDDYSLARSVTVLGGEVKELLFPNGPAVGKTVYANGHSYKVVGTFKSPGTSGMGGADRSLLIPLTTLRNHRPSMGSLTMSVFVDDPGKIDYLMEEAKGQFRLVRRLRLDDEDNFTIVKSEEILDQLFQTIAILTFSATAIAIITLLGASVALLNVMLVSVTERTNEIGLRKALGASKRSILLQFLMEAIMICQVGGLFGVAFGIILGNFASSFLFERTVRGALGLDLHRPDHVLLCGDCLRLLSCLKAARVDPIDSLRYE